MKIETFVEPDRCRTTILIQYDDLEELHWDVIKTVVEKQLKK